jgi:CheY-like chemotaxis protein
LAAANDLITVLNATLDSETAEAGALAVDASPFDPGPMVLALAMDLRSQAAAKALEFTVFIDPDLEDRSLGAAMADETRVRQVLAALMSNAMRYTVRGRIEARLELIAPDRLRIAIADTGPGLSVDELNQAFEPFKRIERTAAGVPGAGLGLSLSRQLVKLMGAEITAESAVGVGSCFALEIPYEPTAVLTAAVDEEDAPRTRKGLRVMLAEDDSLSAAAARTVFEQLGHQVVHALNGRRALDLMNAAEFDLIVVAAGLDEGMGGGTAAAIRALPAPMGATPIVGLIGGDAEEADACQAAGVDTLLRKPVSVQAVARAVAEATARGGAAKRKGRAAA